MDINVKNFPDEYQVLPEQSEIGFLLISRLSDGKMFKIDIARIISEIGIISTGAKPIPVSGFELPTINAIGQPISAGDYMILTQGTYTGEKGPVVVPSNNLGIVVAKSDGSSYVWVVRNMELPSTPIGPGGAASYDDWIVSVDASENNLIDSESWVNGTKIVNNGAGETLDAAWQYLRIPVSAGNTLRGLTRGDGNAFAVGFYTNENLSSIQNVLVTYGSGSASNMPWTVNAPSNGFIIVNNRNYEYTAGDLFIYLFADSSSTTKKVDAQYFEDADKTLRNIWLVEDSSQDGVLPITWRNGQYFDLGGATYQPNAAYQASDPVNVEGLNHIFYYGTLGGSHGLYVRNSQGVGILSVNATSAGQPADTFLNGFRIELPAGAASVIMSSPIDARNGLRSAEPEYVMTSAQELKDQIGRTAAQPYTGTSVILERPLFMTLELTGALPTDESPNRTPTSLSFVLRDHNNQAILAGFCDLSIQGNGSVQYLKKGFTWDVFNAAREALTVKFGNMVAVDSYHMKAYATDRTHSRDVASGRWWADMVRQLEWPYNKINNKVYTPQVTGREAELYTNDAQYYTDGIPMQAMLNGTFLGLYTMRLKKRRENYALNNRNEAHYFIDSATMGAYLRNAFNPANWDLKSPRVVGYEEAGPINDPVVLANINRLFDFTSQLSSRFAEHENFIVLPHWVAWLIHCEVVGQYDINGNNYNIMSWDATRWSIVPYDMDLTLGLDAWVSPNIVRATQNGFITQGADIWNTFRSVYATQIREIYTYLRRSGFLTTANIVKYYYGQNKNIPPSVYVQDAARWPLIWNNAEPTMEQLNIYLNSRITYLDTQWLNP